MDIDMVDKWNTIVEPEDTVYYMGDISFNPKRYRNRLNGKIILIRGNHDKQKYFQLFDEVHEYLTLQVGNYKCFLSHNPINAGDPEFCWRDYRDQAMGHDFYLVGHIHEKWKMFGKNLNVGVDQWNFYPITEEQIISTLDWMEDHPDGTLIGKNRR